MPKNNRRDLVNIAAAIDYAIWIYVGILAGLGFLGQLEWRKRFGNPCDKSASRIRLPVTGLVAMIMLIILFLGMFPLHMYVADLYPERFRLTLAPEQRLLRFLSSLISFSCIAFGTQIIQALRIRRSIKSHLETFDKDDS